jgi:hypothetical protein
MRSAKRGKSTSDVEVTNVSRHGFWLLVSGEEKLVTFETFPWFRAASIGALTHVVMPGPGHLYWPDLDVDLAIESIDYPDRYPLVSRVAEPSSEKLYASTTATRKASNPR